MSAFSLKFNKKPFGLHRCPSTAPRAIAKLMHSAQIEKFSNKYFSMMKTTEKDFPRTETNRIYSFWMNMSTNKPVAQKIVV